ncbi:hypothetical protein CSA56_05205 [candidate division KSB3 bacterium]|uniref:Lysylphosphatidylglycerol synthetase n=1 Tax=candidate division KSB3 bacterium TaxID=2044937 RepID=A0A2G6KHS0_9BACT|nr:MAG: hypothetical protein CSA56_05205 [candidate division KSB3 bacterium]
MDAFVQAIVAIRQKIDDVRSERLLQSKSFSQLLRFGIFVLFILILIRLVDFSLLPALFRQVRLEIVCGAILFYFGNMAIRAYRLTLIFNRSSPKMSFKDAYAMTLIGVALNIFIPATLGDIGRSYYGYKLYGVKERMLSAVIVDKLFAFCALFLLGGIAGLFLSEYNMAAVAFAMAGLTGLPLLFPALVPWMWLNRLLAFAGKSLNAEELVSAFRLPFKLKFVSMEISLAGWLSNSIFFYVLCLAFAVEIEISYVLFIMPAVSIARLFPFTINALGPTELAFTYFLGLIGINPTVAISMSLLSNMISSIIPGSVGFILMGKLGKAA